MRIERVQSITEEDALAEGVSMPVDEIVVPGSVPVQTMPLTARMYFRHLWDQLYPGSWDRNDWVWRYEFRRTVRPGEQST